MRNVTLHSLALACALVAAAPAHADNVTFTGFAHGSETVTFTLSAPNVPAGPSTVSAGGFSTILNGGPSFVSYCIDLYQTVSFGTLYTDYNSVGAGHTFANSTRAYADLARLYATAGVVDTSVKEAAFQIAVWEIAYETDLGSYSLSGGKATFSGGTAAGSALGLASTWLSGLAASGPAVSVLESREHQDVVYAPIPEPETYALMLAGLGAMGFVARRRKA